MTSTPIVPPQLNLIGTSCPMAFVKTRLYLDACSNGDIISLLFEDTAANEPLVRSVTALGHTVKSERSETQNKIADLSAKNTVGVNSDVTLQLKVIIVQVKKLKKT